MAEQVNSINQLTKLRSLMTILQLKVISDFAPFSHINKLMHLAFHNLYLKKGQNYCFKRESLCQLMQNVSRNKLNSKSTYSLHD